MIIAAKALGLMAAFILTLAILKPAIYTLLRAEGAGISRYLRPRPGEALNFMDRLFIRLHG